MTFHCWLTLHTSAVMLRCCKFALLELFFLQYCIQDVIVCLYYIFARSKKRYSGSGYSRMAAVKFCMHNKLFILYIGIKSKNQQNS